MGKSQQQRVPDVRRTAKKVPSRHGSGCKQKAVVVFRGFRFKGEVKDSLSLLMLEDGCFQVLVVGGSVEGFWDICHILGFVTDELSLVRDVVSPAPIG